MDDNNDLNLELDVIEQGTDRNLKIKERFGKLSEKVSVSNKEKEDALAKAKLADEGKVAIERELNFYKDFSKASSKYQNASEYQDKIFEKVKSGYSTEDAIVSVLNAQGKLNQQGTQSQQPVVQTTSRSAEGGSSINTIDGDKPIEKMNRAEKLAALMDAERRGEILNA